MSPPSRPRVLILRAAGTNCDYETQYAFQKAGAEADRVHINRVVERKSLLREYHILAIPGGFSYGDDIASGKILANELRFGLKDELNSFVEDGKLIIGICNGFQVLVKAGLLPWPNGHQDVTLTFNDSNKFEDRWVYLKAESDRCVFVEAGQDCYLPVAHAEGKFVTRNSQVLDDLSQKGQVVFRYVPPEEEPAGGSPPTPYPWNPNGSMGDVAGVCDSTGRIFGLMPHPERHIEPTQHPRWTREVSREELASAEGDGMAVFRNALRYVKNNLL